MDPKKISVINKLVVTGIERLYTAKEWEAMEQELLGKELAEHEELKAAGKLDEVEAPDYEEQTWTEKPFNKALYDT